MFGAILKATNSSFQNGMTFCRSIYKERIMKLLAFIFEQPSYIYYLSPTVLTYIIQKLLLRLPFSAPHGALAFCSTLYRHS